MRRRIMTARMFTTSALAKAMMLSLVVLTATPALALNSNRSGSPFEAVAEQAGMNQDLSSGKVSNFELLAKGAFDLLHWLRSNIETRENLPAYNRRQHFGSWVNDNPTENCYDTRNEVLIRDASDPSSVAVNEKNKCQVVKGSWPDPYTGQEYKLASAIQVDHVVPLRNAFNSGAHQWQPPRRCHYANYMGNEFHLRAVNGHENMSKGDKGPEGYMPPNAAFACQYLKEWMKIKAIWGLKVTEDEATSIVQLIQDHRCARDTAQVDAAFLDDQRRKSRRPTDRCNEFGLELATERKAIQVPPQTPPQAPIETRSQAQLAF